MPMERPGLSARPAIGLVSMSYVFTALCNALVGLYCCFLALRGNRHQRKVFIPLAVYFIFAAFYSLAQL